MKKFCVLLIILVSKTLLLAHSPEEMPGLIIGEKLFFNKIGTGINTDISYNLYFLNGSANFSAQDKAKPDYSIYLGIGMMNIIQVQYGTNFSENKIRLRSDLPILHKGPIWMYSREHWYTRINLEIHYEWNLNAKDFSNFGIGFGYLF